MSMNKNGHSSSSPCTSSSTTPSSIKTMTSTPSSSSLPPRLTQVIPIHNVKDFVKNYLNHHHGEDGSSSLHYRSDTSLLFRHVYCLFRETLYYSQPSSQQQPPPQASNTNFSSSSLVGNVNISSSSASSSGSSPTNLNPNSNNNTNTSNGLPSCPKGFSMMYDDGSQVICLFFELDTKRLASEAQVYLTDSMLMNSGSTTTCSSWNDFMYVMVRITWKGSSIHSKPQLPTESSLRVSSHQKPSSSSFVAFEEETEPSIRTNSNLQQQQSLDSSQLLFQHQVFNCSEVNLKTFCEEYVKMTNHKAAVANIMATFGGIEKSIRSSENLQVEVFKNCTCRSFSGDHFTVAKDILGLCKIALFDKTARKGLQKEQLDYYAALKQDKPFYTLLKRMEKLTHEIILPMFSLLNYCHRTVNVSLSHMLFKFNIRFRVLSVEPISPKQNHGLLQRVRSNSSISASSSSSALNMAHQRNRSFSSSTSTAGLAFRAFTNSHSCNNEKLTSSSKDSGIDCVQNDEITNIQPSLLTSSTMTTNTIYEPDIKTEQRMISLPRGPFIYKPLPLEPHTRKSAIEKDIFCMGILFLTYVTGYKDVGEIQIAKVEEMLKQLRVCVDYLRQAQVQFDELINTKKCGDATKIYLLCERYSHITALLYSLSTLEKLISEMVENKTCAFKDMLYLTDSTKIEDLIDTLRDKTFNEKTNSCNIPRSPALGNLIRQEQEKKKALSERSRNILSNIPNSLLAASSPDSPTLLSPSNNAVNNNKRKREAMTINSTPPTLNQQQDQGSNISKVISCCKNYQRSSKPRMLLSKLRAKRMLVLGK
ncbi:hypothetical protein C9374_007596 [Naegleria lovaniensis]|uniref:Uncharacterized protein n=1 Tax=Naegleria lovaniensis TaxID=51637 RepID=A0AA88KIJ4_NAELO|nr:uncharacterized protein C9374_007596 [Naegleria lovaniensis]KAG2378958.1 hypothetical protein C9374_007596 [Naegleria lovaniensis]